MKAFLEKTLNNVTKFLESVIAIPVFFNIMILGWLFNLTYVSVFVMAVSVALIFLLCRDVKNAFVPILYISFFLNDIALEANIVLYGAAIGIAVVSFISFIVIKLVKERKTLKKGNMFWAFVISAVAFLLGGCIGHFRILVFFAILGLCLVTYFLYWVAINFCTNFQQFLFRIMLYGAIYIVLVFLVSNYAMGGFYESITRIRVFWVGAQHINTAAVFLVFGVLGAFALGFKKKYDYLYFAAACVLMIVLFLTYCRLMILLGGVAFIVLTVVMIMKSPKKLNFTWAAIALCIVFGILCAVFWGRIEHIVNTIVWKVRTGSNGREELWSWCFEKFLQNPVFGYGFLSAEPVPSLRDVIPLVLAHNTALQWLASLGVVGSALMIYFYYKKYRIIFTKPLMEKLFLIITLIVIELNGLLDQTATMDVFVVALTYLLIAACEEVTPNVKQIELFKKKNKRVD